jgi:DNA topoisomerase IB
MLTAIALAERVERHGFPETKTDEKRSLSAVMQRVAQQLGNTAAVCRASYVSPAVIDQYLERRTIEDFRPRHLRVVGAREVGLDAEELALLSLLRSWRIRRARLAA